jgi:uncharacterized protein YdeI (YjbR/CyaY-like superfamily)
MIDTDKYEGVKGSLVHSISTQEWKKLSPAAQALLADAPLLLAEVKQLSEENKMLRHGINDAISMSSSGAKTPVADGSIKHYFPLYLLEMIE